MHKGWTKRLALMHHVPIVPFLEMDIREYRENPRSIFEKIEERFTYPVWVKPAHLGSSIAVRRADDLCALQKAVENAYSYDDCILIEPHIEGRQIEFGILGNEYLRVGPSCEILNKGAFVDYGDKYGPNAMPYAIPARLSEIEEALGIDLAKTIYLAARCRGLARVDFFIDHDGCFWFNEINSFPGCTNTSAFPKIWAAAGVSMEHICDDLIASAFQRKRHLEAISYRS
jgi:UDP-N-acetylmuramate--alanine ligase